MVGMVIVSGCKTRTGGCNNFIAWLRRLIHVFYICMYIIGQKHERYI